MGLLMLNLLGGKLTQRYNSSDVHYCDLIPYHDIDFTFDFWSQLMLCCFV
jgi:hypothetical protein